MGNDTGLVAGGLWRGRCGPPYKGMLVAHGGTGGVVRHGVGCGDDPLLLGGAPSFPVMANSFPIIDGIGPGAPSSGGHVAPALVFLPEFEHVLLASPVEGAPVLQPLPSLSISSSPGSRKFLFL